ncbi:hypothetical protein [Rhizobium sp. BK008]|uniref:hypothetical protein n=1 Tax=Rhizobium sp. BK008 TaxID=2587094 RepID=UPI0016122F60|nr:hypothetical protein [Rhizobium sp. BK008]MBB4255453.1 hypothetical protein [Rhizobium sp. BK008]
MGYYLSSLAELPRDDDVKIYIFVLTDGVRSDLHDALQRNFLAIAKGIGTEAVIATGFDEHLWTEDLMKRYLGDASIAQFYRYLPGVLITDSHPDEITEQSLKIVVPLEVAQKKFGSVDAFFSALIAFAKGRNQEFLGTITSDQSAMLNIIAHLNDIVDLKPNFAGLGINLNAAVNKWLNRAA